MNEQISLFVVAVVHQVRRALRYEIYERLVLEGRVEGNDASSKGGEHLPNRWIAGEGLG